jgi:hypothetical protein
VQWHPTFIISHFIAIGTRIRNTGGMKIKRQTSLDRTPSHKNSSLKWSVTSLHFSTHQWASRVLLKKMSTPRSIG